jgi:O-antigen/teichoic acid export membrane protein
MAGANGLGSLTPVLGGEHKGPVEVAGTHNNLSLGRTIASGTAWSGLGRFGVLSFGFVGQALTARLLSPADFGSYTLILSVAGSVALIAQLGLPQSTVRHIAQANTAPGGSQARSAICTSAALALVMAAVGSALGLWPLGQLVDQIFPDVRLMTVLAFFAALVGIQVLENITPELFRGVRDFRNGSMFGGFLSALLLATLTTIVLMNTDATSLETALAISITASALSLAAAAVLLWRKLRFLPRTPKTRLLDAGVLSPAMWFAAVINYAIAQLDLWVVGALGGGRDIALYSAAFRLATLVMVPLTIVNFVVSPLVVELLARDQPTRLQRAVQTVATIAGVPALVTLALFAVFGSRICELVYGDFYIDAGPPLVLLAVGKLAGVLAGSCGITLLMSGGQRMSLGILAINIVMTLPMQVVGFQLAGLAGLAAATSIGFALQNLHQVIAVRRRIGVLTTLNLTQTFQLARDLAGRGVLREVLIPKRSRAH